jgi:hypothetical protein
VRNKRATTQDRVIADIERETIDELDGIFSKTVSAVSDMWVDTKKSLKSAIGYEYQHDFGGDWNLPHAMMMGTMERINQKTRSILSDFYQESKHYFGMKLKEIYWESVHRHAYQLDVTTPPSFKVKLPLRPSFKEAMTVNVGPAAVIDWEQRWATWMDSYSNALQQNMILGAINESTAVDAMDEVDATRVGSPSYDIWDAMNRIIMAEMVSTSSMGAVDVAEANPELDVVEIWKARDWIRVCDDCDANDGAPADEADGEIPLHPNCNCYYRLVPASWASLLRSGDADDVELARQMDAMGRVPSSMLMRDDEGNLRGALIVSFEKWAADNLISIMGGR